MSVKVFTYDNPTQVFNNDINLNQSIHICATSNMAEAISKSLEDTPLNTVVLSMSEFNSLILESWFSEETILVQHFELMEFLDQIEDQDKPIIQSYKKNRRDLLETLRLLYIVDLNPDSLYTILSSEKFSEKEILLPEIYSWFSGLKHNKSFIEYSIKNKEELIKKVEKKKAVQFHEQPSIIFHGFYFITPEQQRVMEFIRSLNLKLSFLHYYDADYPSTFDFITKFTNENYGWPSKKKWKSLKSDAKYDLSDIFSKKFEGTAILQIEDKKLKKYTFNNFTDFLTHIELNNYLEESNEKTKDSVIMTTNSNYMNNRMEEFYPDSYKSIRNFLKYPIGYLLVKLHEMWNANNQRIEADSSLIYKVLSTRYFFSDEEDYLLSAYKEIQLFFIDCLKREEWIAQFEKLIDIRELIEENFHNSSSEVDKFHINFNLDVNESPFSYFPHLSVSSNNLKMIIEKIKEVFDLAKELFSEETTTVIVKEHFDKLLSIVDLNPNQQIMDPYDLDIIEELKNKLKVNINIDKVNKDYLSEAIQFYLSGTSSTDTEELIEPLINIDGELFRDRLIHVTGLDEKGLPYGKYELPWPLSEELIEKLAEDNGYIQLLIHRNESVTQITRYLLHILFKQADKIELSHIKNYEDNHDLKQSFYIDLIQLNIDEQTNIHTPTFSQEAIALYENNTYDISKYSLDKRAEYISYPNRLLYSKASKQTTYNTVFQQKWPLSKLAMYLLGDTDRDIVEEFLIELFPALDRLSIELIVEEAIKYTSAYKKVFGNKKQNLSDYRKSFLFPSLIWKQSNFDPGSINYLYQEASNVKVIQDKDFSNQKLDNSYIYPYRNLDYPEDFKEEQVIE